MLKAEHLEALAAMESGDFVRAGDLLSNVHVNSPTDWIAANDLALCRYMAGDAAGADKLLEGILAREPGNSFALLNRYYVGEAGRLRREPPPDPKEKIESVRGGGPEAPLITVVMPTFNRPVEIRESIESVRSQTRADWELIVVNDGGGREVEAVLDPYLKDPRIRYVYIKHGGLSAARNAGMALAKGAYITQLDDDDIYYPEHLATVARAFAEDPARKIVYTDFYRAHQEKRGAEWVTVRRVVDYSNDFSRALLKSGTIAPVCNVTHSREALETAGYYNERVLRAMDWEYFIRLAKCYDFTHIKAVTGEFRQRSDRSQMTRSFTIPRNFHRNLVSWLHGFFPLTGARFARRDQGDGFRLKAALDRLIAADREFFIQRLELRKLLAEPYYALFYTLGKRLEDEGLPDKARAAFRAAAGMRPYEIKAWLKWFSTHRIK